jgi:hypothetical protein
MSDDETDDDAGDVCDWGEPEEPTPDTDPRHIDPAGDMADLIESGEVNVELADDQSPEELREFIEAVERGDHDPVDPGTEAMVRIARAMLADSEDTDS